MCAQAFLEKMCVDKIPDSTYALFWSREDASKRNQDCNDRVTGDVLAELAVDVSMSGTVSEQISSQRDKFIADLPLEGKVIVVKEGAPMMLLTNMDVSKGAYRGAIGTVSDVVRGEEDAITSIKLVMHDGSEFLVEPRVEVIEDESSKCTISFWPLGYGFAGTYDSAQVGVVPPPKPPPCFLGLFYRCAPPILRPFDNHRRARPSRGWLLASHRACLQGCCTWACPVSAAIRIFPSLRM